MVGKYLDGEEKIPLFGAADDPNWEVIGSGTINKTSSETVPFHATGFNHENIYLNYNFGSPVEIGFKKDKISFDVKSGKVDGNGDYISSVKFMTFAWCSEPTGTGGVDLTAYLDGSNPTGYGGILPTSGVNYVQSFELSEFISRTDTLTQDFVTTKMVPNNYKLTLTRMWFIVYSSTGGLTINDFSLIKRNTAVADALDELQAAIDGLETVKETTLHDGAKIRTSGAQGLMFGTMVDSAIKNAYIASGYTPTVYGTVLLPADMIPAGGELTKETAKAVYKEFTANEYPNLSEYSVYLIGWTEESQMTREITARSYVVYQKGEEQIAVYSSNTVTRSVYTVAINIYNEESGNPPLEDNLENGRTAYNWLTGGGA